MHKSKPSTQASSPMSEDKKQPVEVEREVFEGIEAVRRSGLTNMLDRTVVAELAEGLGFDQAACWVRDNRELYAQAIFHGFEVER